MERTITVIGGGLAGLTCAYALKRRGIDSTVFEATARSGGRDLAALYLLSPDLFRNTFQLSCPSLNHSVSGISNPALRIRFRIQNAQLACRCE